MATSKKGITLLYFGLIIGVFVVCSAAYAYATVDTIDITVTKMERISVGSGKHLSHKYLVFTETETLENTDSLWYMKFNSSDIQGRLPPGKYRVKVFGWRIPTISSYRNIVEIILEGDTK